MEKYRIAIIDGKYWLMKRKHVFWWKKLIGFGMDYNRALKMIACFRNWE